MTPLALKANEVVAGEVLRGAYRFPDACCISLVRAACEAVGGPVPEARNLHEDDAERGEARALAAWLRTHGTLSAAYQSVLAGAGWTSVRGRRLPLDLMMMAHPEEAAWCVPAVVGGDYALYGWAGDLCGVLPDLPLRLHLRYRAAGEG